MKKTNLEKEAIISEYLLGDTTYRKLEKKYGVDFRIIHSWVTKFEGYPPDELHVVVFRDIVYHLGIDVVG